MDKMENARWLNSRQIIERVVITGRLVLETPARLGNGDSTGLIDMPLALDMVEGRALLTGSSLAGALRSYLREYLHRYGREEESNGVVEQLFGHQRDADGEQSLLIVADALGEQPGRELRDGVRIDPVTRTAEDKKKYDFELLEAGTYFDLRLELLVRQERGDQLRQGLAVALQGLQKGEIALGARRRRGFGRCSVAEWQVRRYVLTEPQQLLWWLRDDGQHNTQRAPQEGDLFQLLGASAKPQDQRRRFCLTAIMGLASSLLIRSGGDEPKAPDMVQLKSKRNQQAQPILSGSSLAGALRARANRICRTLGDDQQAKTLINRLFGPAIESPLDTPWASRVWVEESVIEQPHELVVSRVKIDRFTGGSFPAALFSQQPVFGTPATVVQIKLMVQDPTEAEIGLLLLVLKDLWTADLPVGGEASVGRGRLHGRQCTLELYEPATTETMRWEIHDNGELTVQWNGEPTQSAQASLQSYVTALCNQMEGKV